MTKHLTFAEAIARQEGFYISGSRAARNNNPGNLNWGAFAQAHGAMSCEPDGKSYRGRFAVFPNPSDGWAALEALFRTDGYRGLTVQQALLRYAPPADSNDTASYLHNFCEWVGCQPTDLMEALL